ncbi:MAG: glycosyltransferase [Bdellovibrionota bacterium]
MREASSISVVVPARNAESHLFRTLEAVFTGLAETKDAEVIVVNDSSTDSTSSIIRQFNCTELKCFAGNRAAARNVGLRAARGELVAFIDADTIVEKTWFQEMKVLFRHGVIGGAQGTLSPEHNGSPTLLNRYREDLYQRVENQNAIAQFFPIVATGACMYRREQALAAGGFDETLSDCEDMDLSWKILAAGHALGRTSNARASTGFYPETFRRYVQRAYQRGKGAYQLFAKWQRIFNRNPIALACSTSQLVISQRRVSLTSLPWSLLFAYAVLEAAHCCGVGCGWLRAHLRPSMRTTPLPLSTRTKTYRLNVGQTTFQVPDDVCFFSNDGVLRLIHMRTLQSVALSESGGTILECVLTGCSEEHAIVERVAEAFSEPPAAVLGDYRELVNELSRSGWLESAP